MGLFWGIIFVNDVVKKKKAVSKVIKPLKQPFLHIEL
jgi:hypothetical protein